MTATRELRAFLNVCRHRGATLCLTDAGDVGRSIRCPYHSWTYRLDGSLMSAPNWRSMAAVDKVGYGLHPVALAEWHGLVWLNLAENPAPFEEQVWRQLDYRLGGDRAKFGRYDLAGLVAGKRVDYTVAANWKIIQENFQECYHCATIHPELVDALPQFRNLATSGAYSTDGYYFAEDKASFSVSGNRAAPAAGSGGRRRPQVLRHGTPAQLLPFAAAGPFIAHRFEPVSPEVTTVVCEWLSRRGPSPPMT